jgi:glycosyltransferase involved in cell wall biosynthesis
MSGISVYTIRLANALAGRHRVSLVTMRQLLPSRLYPGRDRIGQREPIVALDQHVRVAPPVDWSWGRGLPRTLRWLWTERPDVVVLEWWTGTVLHTYLVLALVMRVRGAAIVVEFHEILDTAELRIAPARAYVRVVAPLLMSLARGFVIHSESDREPLDARFGIGRRPVAVVPHGPYDHLAPGSVIGAADAPSAPSDEGICRLLYFGVIRPYKGVEDLVRAFDLLAPEEIDRWHLTIVGETWESWTEPLRLVAESRYRSRMTVVNRYVDDSEVPGIFGAADVVVLPYRRSSSSGPLHIAMSAGLPVVVTRVGGLPEAVEGYEGAVTVPPGEPAVLLGAIRSAASRRGRRFADPHSWERSEERFTRLLEELVA